MVLSFCVLLHAQRQKCSLLYNLLIMIEIMSPVGSYESLAAAIHAGAGSVYFGVGKMNMRSRSAANFTLDDLQNITDICDTI